jgi:hypothetical protein
MAKPKAESWDADAILERLHAQAGLDHLRVRHRADLVTIESGPEGDPVLHARLRRVAVSLWTLEMATHNGRWEKTPYRATRDKIVDTLMQDFGWVLEPID